MIKKSRTVVTLVIITFLVLILVSLDLLKDRTINDDFNNNVLQQEDKLETIYRPSTYNTDEWETCESEEFGLSLKHPKEFECKVSLLNYSGDKKKFYLELSVPGSENGNLVVNDGPIVFSFDRYDSLDQVVTFAVGESSETTTTTAATILSSIKNNSNIEVDSRPGHYESSDGPWSEPSANMYYRVEIVNGTNVLIVIGDVSEGIDTSFGRDANAEFEKLFKTILSTITFK